MQAVQEQEVRDQLVVEERVFQVIATQAADALNDAPQPLAVELEEGLHHLRGLGPGVGIFEGLDLLEQRLHLADALSELPIIQKHLFATPFQIKRRPHAAGAASVVAV